MYEITVRQNATVLHRECRAILTLNQDDSMLLMDHDSPGCRQPETRYEPTDGFWEALIEVNQYTSHLAEEINNLHVTDHIQPDLYDWKVMAFPTLPKYEEELLVDIQYRLLQYRQETTSVFSDYLELQRLFREAHENVDDQDVPWYLAE